METHAKTNRSGEGGGTGVRVGKRREEKGIQERVPHTAFGSDLNRLHASERHKHKRLTQLTAATTTNAAR